MDFEMLDGIRSKLSLSNMGKPALAGVALLIVMVAVLAGRNIFDAATAKDFDAPSRTAIAQSEEAPYDSGSVKTVFVHVSGAVANPGLYEVDAGARVAAAIDAAGGFTDEAEPGSINLARKLEDGEMVVVASKSAEVLPEGQVSSAQPANSLVNINTASASELQALPGVGPSIAERIVGDRTANGAFRTVEDLKRVPGIGDKKYDALSGLICV